MEEGNSSRQAVATRFGIGKSTVHDIHKRRDKIRSFASLHNPDDISKRRRVNPVTSNRSDDVVYKQEPDENCEEELIDSIEEFDYQEINEQDYEIVYEASLPNMKDEHTDGPIKDSPKSKRKSKTLTFREKYDVIHQIENGVSVPAICEQYGIGRTTVYDYMRRKQEIFDFIEKSNDGERRTFKKSKFPEVEERVMRWCEVKEKFTKQQFYDHAKLAFDCARENAMTNSPSGFCGSWSWAKRFFHRHPNLKKKLVTVSGQPVDPLDLALSTVEYLDESIDDRSMRAIVPSEEPPGVKRIKYLNLSEKLQVLNDIDAGKSVPVIAQKYGVSKTTIYDIFRRREELRDTKLTKSNYLRKVMKLPRYPQLEFELLQWCLQQQHFPLSNVLIAEQAKCLFYNSGLSGSFNATSGWVKKFILRNPELCEKQGIAIDDELPEIEATNDESVEEDYLDDDGEEEEETKPSFEFMEPEVQPPDYQEEYIIEELDVQEDEELVIEAIKENQESSNSSKKVLTVIKKDGAANITPIPESVVRKSLKILIKYSEQQGHDNMLSQLIDYQRQLQHKVS